MKTNINKMQNNKKYPHTSLCFSIFKTSFPLSSALRVLLAKARMRALAASTAHTRALSHSLSWGSNRFAHVWSCSLPFLRVLSLRNCITRTCVFACAPLSSKLSFPSFWQPVLRLPLLLLLRVDVHSDMVTSRSHPKVLIWIFNGVIRARCVISGSIVFNAATSWFCCHIMGWPGGSWGSADSGWRFFTVFLLTIFGERSKVA